MPNRTRVLRLAPSHLERFHRVIGRDFHVCERGVSGFHRCVAPEGLGSGWEAVGAGGSRQFHTDYAAWRQSGGLLSHGKWTQKNHKLGRLQVPDILSCR